MKNLLLVLFTFCLFSASAQISFKTGSVQFDTDLNTINAQARADFGSFKADVQVAYNVDEKKLDFMSGSLQMEPGEIYLALEISKVARVPLDDVLTVYKTDKNKGWGVIAKEVGIKPGSAEFHQLKNNASSKKGKGNKSHPSKNKGNKKQPEAKNKKYK